jgi:peptidoglycan-N-acetylmuramic acid deacetylase
MLSACTGRKTLEETNANVPVTVEDKRTAAKGKTALQTATFSVNDPENKRGLSTKKIGHSYGVAKDGMPHHISVDNQKYFESTGYKVFCYDTKTKEKVLYLTFDCGYENGYTYDVLDVLKEKNVSAAFFCTLDHIKAKPDLITRMIKEGHIVGNHSDNHPNFSKIDRTKMAEEIQSVENHLRKYYGYSSPYFRFPEGAYNDSALDLVQSLGYKSVFWSLAYSDWDTSAQKGKDYAFNTVTARLHPGAIILLHSVSADNAAALGDIIDYALSQGYVFKPLTQLPK